MEFFRRYRDFFICVFLLGLPFLFLHSNLKAPESQNSVDRIILKLSTPVQYLASMLAKSVTDIWGNYIYLVDVREENEFLKIENQRLRNLNKNVLQLQIENERLKNLLEFKETVKFKLLAAQVIGRNSSPYFKVIRILIDAGAANVKPRMAVVTSAGLVGLIDRVWDRYSDVILMVDPQSSIDIYIKRNQARGLLKGTGDSSRYLCKIEYLLKSDEVVPGDVVLTSGVDRLVPQGIEVGKVSQVRKKDFGLFQEAWVEPSVDFSRIREVFVILSEKVEK